MVWIKFDVRTGALVQSFSRDPGAPGDLYAVRRLDQDFATWTDAMWDASTRDIAAAYAPAPTEVTRGEFLPLLQQIAADVAAIRVKTDKLP